MEENIETDFFKIIDQQAPNQVSKFFNKTKKQHKSHFRTLSKAENKAHEKIFDKVYSK